MPYLCFNYVGIIRQMSKVLYKLTFFCKTKPISPSAQMTLTLSKERIYGNFRLCARVKNKPNSNPIKANFMPNKAKTKPIQTQFKVNFWEFSQKSGTFWPVCLLKVLEQKL